MGSFFFFRLDSCRPKGVSSTIVKNENEINLYRIFTSIRNLLQLTNVRKLFFSVDVLLT